LNYQLKYYKNLHTGRLDPSKQLYLRDGGRFTLTKVSELRSKCTKRMLKKFRNRKLIQLRKTYNTP